MIAGVTTAALAAAPEEAGLIEQLRSTAPAAQKAAACRRLWQIGTAECVPALAPLLSVPEVEQAARAAPETIPGPEAEQALVDALPGVGGMLKVGVITSLGVRGDPAAVPALMPLLGDGDPQVAVAAATALGKCCRASAADALLAALSGAEGPLQTAVLSALLDLGERTRKVGVPEPAAGIFRQVYRAAGPGHDRVAALCGLARTDPDGGLQRTLHGLRGTDRDEVDAALALAAELPGSAATRALAGVLGRLDPRLQRALVTALVRRGDRAAQPALVELARKGDPAIRPAALAALGAIGDTSALAFLAEAASGTGPAREAARQALVRLPGGDFATASLALLPRAKPPVAAELARALAARGERRAAQVLAELASGGEPQVQAAALEALAVLGGGELAPKLIAVLV
ncbi:MAG: HEAT repeat domain-containing protein, partial [Armatimonadetes bacterium]|nr:HEAT repeat domain-containing protein [Armatimonadota bacterium]